MQPASLKKNLQLHKKKKKPKFAGKLQGWQHCCSRTFHKCLCCWQKSMQWSKCLYCYNCIELWLQISSQTNSVCWGGTLGSHLWNLEVPQNPQLKNTGLQCGIYNLHAIKWIMQLLGMKLENNAKTRRYPSYIYIAWMLSVKCSHCTFHALQWRYGRYTMTGIDIGKAVNQKA